MPSVAAVIVNFNGGEFLDRALTALEGQTLKPARTIVVDNASADESVDGLEDRHPGVEVVRLQENTGFAAANNLAVRLADDCEFVALVNPDAFAEPRWLETLLEAARDRPDYAVFSSRLVQAEAPDRLDGTGDVFHVSGTTWRRDQDLPVTIRRGRGEVFSACAAAALYRRDAFVEVGGFDESFFCYYEDSDLSFRLRLAGHRCLHVDDAVALHEGSATTGHMSDFVLYHSLRNQTWTFVKNMPASLLFLYAPAHLVWTVVTGGALARQGRGKVVIEAKRDALRGLPRVLRQRRAIQSARRVRPRELRAVMATGARAFAQSYGVRDRRARTRS
jgi:GT2 family glycosyltransferase